MQDKRTWLPSRQRVELVDLRLEQGCKRRQAAAWRRVSVPTVQHWTGRYPRPHRPRPRVRGMGARELSLDAHHQPTRVSEQVHDRVCEARRRTGRGPRLIAGRCCSAGAHLVETGTRTAWRGGRRRRHPVLRPSQRGLTTAVAYTPRTRRANALRYRSALVRCRGGGCRFRCDTAGQRAVTSGSARMGLPACKTAVAAGNLLRVSETDVCGAQGDRTGVVLVHARGLARGALRG
jgi:hypothetical protein